MKPPPRHKEAKPEREMARIVDPEPGDFTPHSSWPEPIKTQPGTKIVFNVPYDDKHTYHIKIINSSWRRIAVNCSIPHCPPYLQVQNGTGVLAEGQSLLVTVTCDPFSYTQEDTVHQEVVIHYTNLPSRARKADYSLTWFNTNHLMGVHPIPIEYNP